MNHAALLHEVEITAIPPLAPGELSLLDMHSVVNVLNVLRNELCVLGMMVSGREELLGSGIGICDALLLALRDRTASLQAAGKVEELEAQILGEIDAKMPSSYATEHAEEVADTIANIQTVFRIMKVRAREILARAAAPEAWVVMDRQRLLDEFHEVFDSMERNSRGRFRVMFNAPRRHRSDYCIDVRIDGEGDTIAMPAVFKDLTRDLMANARKYTMPGGEIRARLVEDAASLEIEVEDNGRGIPAEEIPRVVEFGRRGSNVGDVRTMGGGFGLTKAFLVTKQFGGRFWIASTVGVGTRVRLSVPRRDRVGCPSAATCRHR